MRDMKSWRMIGVVLVVVAALAGCGRDTPFEPSRDERVLIDMLQRHGGSRVIGHWRDNEGLHLEVGQGAELTYYLIRLEPDGRTVLYLERSGVWLTVSAEPSP